MESPARFYNVVCEVCKEKETPRVAAKKLICCDGYCGRHFHPQCLNVPIEVIEFCKQHQQYLEFKCVDCRRTTAAHAVKAISEAIVELKIEMDDQGTKLRRSLLRKLDDSLSCQLCTSRTTCEVSTQCDLLEPVTEILTQDSDVPIPIPESFEHDESGEWKYVGNKKVWRKWSPSDIDNVVRMSDKSKKKKRRSRARKSSTIANNNEVFNRSPPAFENIGAWRHGPPAAVFQGSNFSNHVSRPLTRHPLRKRCNALKITGLPPNLTEFDLSTYIHNTFNARDVTVRCLTPRNLRFPANYTSFKVTVPSECVDAIRNPRFWDRGTRITEFEDSPQLLGFRELRRNNRF